MTAAWDRWTDAPTDGVELWAVPWMTTIIDTIDPATGRTTLYGRDAAAVLALYPSAVRMTWTQWQTGVCEVTK